MRYYRVLAIIRKWAPSLVPAFDSPTGLFPPKRRARLLSAALYAIAGHQSDISKRMDLENACHIIWQATRYTER